MRLHWSINDEVWGTEIPAEILDRSSVVAIHAYKKMITSLKGAELKYHGKKRYVIR